MTALLTAVLAIGVLAGCSEKTGGNANTTAPTGGEQTSTPPTSGGSSSGLDIAKFVSKPCDVLTKTQLAAFGNLKAPEPRTAPLGPACDWKGVEVLRDSSFTVTLADGQKYDTLLSNSRKSPVFNEQKIDGLRSFNSDDTDGTRDCATAVETSEESAILVQINVASQLKGTKKPCDESSKIATAVISTLRG